MMPSTSPGSIANDTPRRIGLELSGDTNVRPSTERRPSGRGSESPPSRGGLVDKSSRTRLAAQLTRRCAPYP
jgi:hypothetical protein